MDIWDVAVLGGGNAALCAALAAADGGARVILIERASRAFRGGNSRHVRNLRHAHEAGDAFVSGPYRADEFRADLQAVTGGEGDAVLTTLLIEASHDIAAWAYDHGARWQPALRGTLSLGRTNRFFLGGGKSLLNAYYLTAAARGIEVRYDTLATGFVLDGPRCTGVTLEGPGKGPDGRRTIEARAVVVAAGGFESNREWMRRYWGAAADNFAVRGTELNDGRLTQWLFDHGARPVADPTRFHAIAIDARAPRYDAGILSRLDAVPYGIVLNRDGQRFYDEGEDIWPKRYAIWGRLIAEQPGQVAHVVLDAPAIDSFMPSLYPPLAAPTIEELAGHIGLDPATLAATVAAYNRSVVAGTFRDGQLDDCRTAGLAPPKSHWARRIEQPPFYAFPLRPGITFTYHGLTVDATARVLAADGPFENVFAAGEVMAGNILTRGYLAGIGMTIGSVFGRLAGTEAAKAAAAQAATTSPTVAAGASSSPAAAA
ncbi:MAG TPA: FAD-dependent tricarballylate dehydrogenase TcuA [Candidatus Limnocylindrales bacterium]|nr:FAD-dependent tricarballylate dehydrogenase TcuA [Candidatus Limnocylindrales bacterium]